MEDRTYICLKNNFLSNGLYDLVPIRFEDRFIIKKWRNDQKYHLRQNNSISNKEQTEYFENVISKNFQESKPNQILFSFLKENKCVAYGGLVHIDRINLNAELSFLMNTSHEQKYFEEYWSNFISLILKVAFNDMNLNKVFVYAFDLRPHLYPILKEKGFCFEARLINHARKRNEFVDVVIYSIFNSDEKN